jgi:hypothetical protein
MLPPSRNSTLAQAQLLETEVQRQHQLAEQNEAWEQARQAAKVNRAKSEFWRRWSRLYHLDECGNRDDWFTAGYGITQNSGFLWETPAPAAMLFADDY